MTVAAAASAAAAISCNSNKEKTCKAGLLRFWFLAPRVFLQAFFRPAFSQGARHFCVFPALWGTHVESSWSLLPLRCSPSGVLAGVLLFARSHGGRQLLHLLLPLPSPCYSSSSPPCLLPLKAEKDIHSFFLFFLSFFLSFSLSCSLFLLSFFNPFSALCQASFLPPLISSVVAAKSRRLCFFLSFPLFLSFSILFNLFLFCGCRWVARSRMSLRTSSSRSTQLC
jgi:hypothetical protein